MSDRWCGAARMTGLGLRSVYGEIDQVQPMTVGVAVRLGRISPCASLVMVTLTPPSWARAATDLRASGALFVAYLPPLVIPPSPPARDAVRRGMAAWLSNARCLACSDASCAVHVMVMPISGGRPTSDAGAGECDTIDGGDGQWQRVLHGNSYCEDRPAGGLDCRD